MKRGLALLTPTVPSVFAPVKLLVCSRPGCGTIALVDAGGSGSSGDGAPSVCAATGCNNPLTLAGIVLLGATSAQALQAVAKRTPVGTLPATFALCRLCGALGLGPADVEAADPGQVPSPGGGPAPAPGWLPGCVPHCEGCPVGSVVQDMSSTAPVQPEGDLVEVSLVRVSPTSAAVVAKVAGAEAPVAPLRVPAPLSLPLGLSHVSSGDAVPEVRVCGLLSLLSFLLLSLLSLLLLLLLLCACGWPMLHTLGACALLSLCGWPAACVPACPIPLPCAAGF